MKRRHFPVKVTEVGNRKDPYDVFLIDKSGRETVFAHYPKL